VERRQRGEQLGLRLTFTHCMSIIERRPSGGGALSFKPEGSVVG
jgi:hypothetical protein